MIEHIKLKQAMSVTIGGKMPFRVKEGKGTIQITKEIFHIGLLKVNLTNVNYTLEN